MQITLEEAAFGVEKEIEVRKLDTCAKCSGSGASPGSGAVTCSVCRGRGQVVSSRGFFQVSQTCPRCRGLGEVIEKPCPTCNGEGRTEQTSRIKIKIPPGIAHGSRLRSTRNGEAGIRGGDQGDLYIVVHVKEHPIFQREDDNLFCEVPISFSTAALGGEVPVPTLEGKASLKVPAGTQGGQSLQAARQRRGPRQRPRAGRSLRQVARRGPDRLERRATPEAGRIRAALRRAQHPAASKLLRTGQGIFPLGRIVTSDK